MMLADQCSLVQEENRAQQCREEAKASLEHPLLHWLAAHLKLRSEQQLGLAPLSSMHVN